jgi:hypothetical protein
MGGTRTNIKLDTVIIAFQQCLDYNLLRLVFASLKEQVKIRNFAFDVRVWKGFVHNKGEEHGLVILLCGKFPLAFGCHSPSRNLKDVFSYSLNERR